MRYEFVVTPEIVVSNSIPVNDTLIGKYSEVLTVHLNGCLMRSGFGLYDIKDDCLKFFYGLELGDLVTVSASIDLFLFENIFSCSKEELAIYLVSTNKSERQLAELRNKQIKQQEEFIKQLVQEQIDLVVNRRILSK